MSRYEVETHPVLPSPQRQNMPRFFRNKKTTGKQVVKFFHPITKFTAQSTIYINTFLKLSIEKNRFPAKNQTPGCCRV